MKRKIVTILTMFCLIASTPMASYAAAPMAMGGGGGTAEPYYEKTTHILAEMKIEGSTAYCNAEATAKRVCLVNVKMRLQRKEGDSWHTIVSWVGSSTTGHKNMTRSFELTTRGTYRVYALFNVDGEELTYESRTRTY